jgi:hypothetical protein
MTFFEMMLEDHEHERKIALNGCKYLQVKWKIIIYIKFEVCYFLG